MISFIVPAYNEAELLPATLESIHASARALGREYEVIVADDASTDATAEIAESLGARVVPCSHRQIAGTRNSGAAAARGDLLVFVDADTRVNPAVIRAAAEAIDRGAVGGGATVRWDRPVAFEWRVFVWLLIAVFRITRWAAGSFLFCRREDFEAVGGFDERLYAAEEIWLSRALKRRGRFVMLREGVATSSRKLETHSSLEVFGTLFSIVLRGPRAVKRREGLELWYEQRG